MFAVLGVEDDQHAHDGARPDPAVEAAPADIRDSRPDPHEHADPAEHRRVPPRDDTALTVDRDQDALAEIDRRASAEQAATAHAAELEPDEATRRAELARWSEDDEQERTHEEPRHTDSGFER